MRRLWVVLAVFSVLAVCGCSRSQSSASTDVLAASAPPASTPAASEYPPGEEIIASGPIVVENQLDVAAQRDGVIANVSADTGTVVRKGQVLAQMDDRQLAADHRAAEAKLEAIAADVKNWDAEVKVLEADLSRSRKMWDAQLITKEQLDHAEYKVVADRYELEREQHSYVNQQNVVRSLELELEKTSIVAPFDGVVARRYIRSGQRVASGERLFWVTAMTPLRVKFSLPERYAGRVRTGDAIEVSAGESLEVKHTAKVIQISPVIDPSSGTIEVLAEIVGRAAGLRPGMTAHIRIAQPQ
ncbi:MAG: efflux RND transporter periplasmic adaptor subunit [Acidobacteriia bacterium]|nr:efflux RND transporter periplasmic adaptor subunit [Terriglobia bacterium]